MGGGGGRVARTVAEGLAQRGHEVRVQTAALGWRSTREQSPGVEVFRTASGRRLPDTCTVPEMAAYVATSALPALRHALAWRPHVVHAHFALPTGALALALRLLARTPYVLTAHLGDVPGGVPEQTDRLFRRLGPAAGWVWQQAAAATAVSGFVQELAERAYGRPVHRILNGLSLAGRAPLWLPAPGAVPHLLFLGRFNAQKQAPLLIAALARLRDLPWRLTMVGDGPDHAAVRAAVAEHGLGERVTLTGWRTAAEVEALLAEAEVLCLPSSAEGMPVAAIEALKFGLALATSDIPGVRDVVTHGTNGLTAPVGHVATYAENLRALVAEAPLRERLRRASYEKAAEFELEGILAAYEAVLQRAAGLPSLHPIQV